jgi:hypothetical protein
LVGSHRCRNAVVRRIRMPGLSPDPQPTASRPGTQSLCQPLQRPQAAPSAQPQTADPETADSLTRERAPARQHPAPRSPRRTPPRIHARSMRTRFAHPIRARPAAHQRLKVDIGRSANVCSAPRAPARTTLLLSKLTRISNYRTVERSLNEQSFWTWKTLELLIDPRLLQPNERRSVLPPSVAASDLAGYLDSTGPDAMLRGAGLAARLRRRRVQRLC